MHEFDTTASTISLSLRSKASIYIHGGVDVPHHFETTEARIVDTISSLILMDEPSVSWRDFSSAFDPIAEPERKFLSTAASLEASVFDRTISMIATDVAPYIRSIVAYDAQLQRERERLSNLLSVGGKKGKRVRTTRAAISALEGGARNTTRPEKYFGPSLLSSLVLKTGSQSWQDALVEELMLKDGRRSVDRESTSP
jgi:hypothetical protein